MKAIPREERIFVTGYCGQDMAWFLISNLLFYYWWSFDSCKKIHRCSNQKVWKPVLIRYRLFNSPSRSDEWRIILVTRIVGLLFPGVYLWNVHSELIIFLLDIRSVNNLIEVFGRTCEGTDQTGITIKIYSVLFWFKNFNWHWTRMCSKKI
jgi:hypothetical protein